MRPTEPFRREHEALLEHIDHLAQAAREMPGLSEKERELLRGRILDFLHDILLPRRLRRRFFIPSGPSSSDSLTPRFRWSTITRRSSPGSSV